MIIYKQMSKLTKNEEQIIASSYYVSVISDAGTNLFFVGKR